MNLILFLFNNLTLNSLTRNSQAMVAYLQEIWQGIKFKENSLLLFEY